SDAELRNEIALMIVAGFETTAVALGWAFAFLSKHPSVVREVRAEIRSVLGGRVPTVADLPRLELVRQVIEESMRLRPPAWFMSRKAVAEDTVSGITIPAGSNVIISPYLTHRHPDFWPNPEGFDPHRFSSAESKDRHPMAYLPFGGGPRKCIGMAFALMEMQFAVAMVMASYDLHLVPGYEPDVNPSMTLRPLDGCWMTAHRV